MTREELDDWFTKNYNRMKHYIQRGTFIMSKLHWDEDYYGEAIKNIYNYFEKGGEIRQDTIEHLLFVAYRNICFMDGKKTKRYNRIEDMKENRFGYDAFEDKEEENVLLDPIIMPQIGEDIKNYLGEDYFNKWKNWVELGYVPSEQGRQAYFDVKMFLKFKHQILPKLKKRKREITDKVHIFNYVTREFEASMPNMKYLANEFKMSIGALYKTSQAAEPNGEFRTFVFRGYLWDVQLAKKSRYVKKDNDSDQ